MSEITTLSVPAQKKYALVARMAAKSVATSAGANVYVIDNVHHAIQEVFVQGFAHCGEHGTLNFEFEITDEELTTKAWASDSCVQDPEDFNEELNAVILASFCDECEIDEGETWALTIKHSLMRQDL